jgi:hypothetical protein
VLDIDDTFDAVHGHQQLALFNAHCDERCFLPIHISVGDWRFQSPWSSAGLPSISLPCGLSRAGLPLAVQLVGAPFAEEILLATANWCESILEPLPLPPSVAGMMGFRSTSKGDDSHADRNSGRLSECCSLNGSLGFATLGYASSRLP